MVCFLQRFCSEFARAEGETPRKTTENPRRKSMLSVELTQNLVSSLAWQPAFISTAELFCRQFLQEVVPPKILAATQRRSSAAAQGGVLPPTHAADSDA